MKIKKTCSQCGETATKEIEAGDIITPTDGSGMPNGLHHVLWNGCNSNPPFKPVRVLRVAGDMLAVRPLHWDDSTNREQFNNKVYPALTGIPDTKGCHDVFLVYAPWCFSKGLQ